MSKLNTYVHVHDKDGVSHAFGPDDTVPEWAEAAITNESVWAEAPVKEVSEGSSNETPSGIPTPQTPPPAGGTEGKAESESVEIPEGDITDEWTVKQLKAYAKAEDIDLDGATAKKDILAKIAEASKADEPGE